MKVKKIYIQEIRSHTIEVADIPDNIYNGLLKMDEEGETDAVIEHENPDVEATLDWLTDNLGNNTTCDLFYQVDCSKMTLENEDNNRKKMEEEGLHDR